jgi:hypothetical protein
MKRKAPRIGRPPGPPEGVRRCRTTLMLTDAEMAVLAGMAAARGIPIGTMLYQLVAGRLRPTRRGKR